MLYRKAQMTEGFARDILQWTYEPPYDFYNHDLDEESLRELLEYPYCAVLDETGRLIGFYCTGASAQVPSGHATGAYDEECLDIGLGMRPDLTGQGRGKAFFAFVLESIAKTFRPNAFRLTVAEFNNRAILLYSRAGFSDAASFSNGVTAFRTMIKQR